MVSQTQGKPTKGQIKWFWKQCGWTYDKELDYWYPPNDPRDWRGLLITYSTFEMRDMIDLNNLFLYAVPKLFNKGLDIYLFSDDGYYFAYAVTNDLEHKRCFDSIVGTEDPALALFCTINKALGGKE